jgi:glycine cleavage system H lipoate-binding protein
MKSLKPNMMKVNVFLLAGIMLMYAHSVTAQNADPLMAGGLKFYAAPGLETLVSNWSAALGENQTTPETWIPGNGEVPDGITFIYGDQMTDTKFEWRMLAGRDVMVPVMNARHPMMQVIKVNGISLETLAEMLTSPSGSMSKTETGREIGQQVKIHANTSVPEILTIVQNFLKIEFESSHLQAHDSKENFLAAMLAERSAIGFCRLTDILTPDGQEFVEGINILPLDRNNNGRLDPAEKIYENPDKFSRAVWMGKYPKALSRNIYAVSSEIIPAGDALAFQAWLFSEGQEILSQSGFNTLTTNEAMASLRDLKEYEQMTAVQPKPSNAWLGLFSAVMLLIVISVVFGIWLIKRKSSETTVIQPVHKKGQFSDSEVSAPAGLYYDTTHTWTFMEDNGSLKVGIDDFLRHILGQVSKIGLKPAGVKIYKGEPLASINSDGKRLVIKSPVSGTIVDRNINIDSFPGQNELIQDWLYVIEPSNWKREMEFLFLAGQYKSWLRDEFNRLKDFLAKTLHNHAPQFVPVVMQDGGELAEGFMADLGPEIWEDFQSEFLDNSPYTSL